MAPKNHNNLSFPDCWWITPDVTSLNEGSMLLDLLAERVTQGIRYIQYRQTRLNNFHFTELYQIISAYCDVHHLHLITNSTPEQAQALDAMGCYLNSDSLMQCKARPLTEAYWIGAYCHNLTELQHAEQIDLDFVSLSPVKKTLTHPDHVPLGWDGFKQLAAQVSLPVYALGGMTLADIPQAIHCGGQGIMGIRMA